MTIVSNLSGGQSVMMSFDEITLEVFCLETKYNSLYKEIELRQRHITRLMNVGRELDDPLVRGNISCLRKLQNKAIRLQEKISDLRIKRSYVIHPQLNLFNNGSK